MTRTGSALALAMIAVSVAVLAAGSLGASFAARRHAAQDWHQRLQARELALGALTLPVGTHLEVVGWRVLRDADGARVTGLAGTYRIPRTGREAWEPAPR